MMLWLLTPALAAPVELDPAPPLLYLDPATLRQHLHAQLGALETCFADLTDADFTLGLTLGRDGVATEPILTPADPGRQACLASALAELSFPPHHEDPLQIESILVWRAGRLVPHPHLTVATRPVDLLFIHVSDPDVASALWASLQGTPAED